MRSNIFKLAMVVAMVALLGACKGEEQRAAAPEPRLEQPAIEQARDALDEKAEETRQGTGEAADTAGEKSREGYEAVKETAADTYEQTKETTADAAEKTKEGAVVAYDRTKEAAAGAVDKTKEMADTAVEKTKEVTTAATDVDLGVVIYEARNGNVSFDHKMHAEAVACNLCHTVMPAATIALDQASAHELCIGCHRDQGAGPTTCAACHIRQ